MTFVFLSIVAVTVVVVDDDDVYRVVNLYNFDVIYL